jgi:hypothetical protein
MLLYDSRKNLVKLVGFIKTCKTTSSCYSIMGLGVTRILKCNQNVKINIQHVFAAVVIYVCKMINKNVFLVTGNVHIEF